MEAIVRHDDSFSTAGGIDNTYINFTLDGTAHAVLLYNMSARADGGVNEISNHASFWFKLRRYGQGGETKEWKVDGFRDNRPLVGQFEFALAPGDYRLEIQRDSKRSRVGIGGLGTFRALATGQINFEIGGVELRYRIRPRPVITPTIRYPLPIRPDEF